MESNKENAETSSEEVTNIYKDIEDFDLGSEIEKLKEENEILENHIDSLDVDIKKLTAALLKLRSLQDNLTKNISSLFLTAKKEIERKDRIIADLRSQLDDLTFRRIGMSYQKRKADETLEANNKKPRYQASEDCAEQKIPKPTRQISNDLDELSIEEETSSSREMICVERNVSPCDEQCMNKTREMFDERYKYEESDYNEDRYHDRYYMNIRSRSKSRHKMNRNRNNSRDRRQQYDEDEIDYRIQEEYHFRGMGQRHDNFENNRFRRKDEAERDRRKQRFGRPVKYSRRRETDGLHYSRRGTNSEKDANFQNDDTNYNEYSNSELVPGQKSDKQETISEKSVKPIRKKLRVVHKLEKKRNKKLDEKNSEKCSPNTSLKSRKSTGELGNILSSNINEIMDGVLLDIDRILPRKKQYSIQIDEIAEEQINKLKKDSQEGTKKAEKLTEVDKEIQPNNKNELQKDHDGENKHSEGCKDANKFDYSSGESGTVRENIMKQSDMETLLKQTLTIRYNEDENISELGTEQELQGAMKDGSKKDIIVNDILFHKDFTKTVNNGESSYGYKHFTDKSSDGNSQTRINILEENLKETKQCTEKISRGNNAKFIHENMARRQTSVNGPANEPQKISGASEKERKRNTDKNSVAKSSDPPRMNPSYKIPKKDPNSHSQNNFENVLEKYNPLEDNSPYKRTRRSSEKSERRSEKERPRSYRSRSEARYKNKHNTDEQEIPNRSYQRSEYERSRSRTDTDRQYGKQFNRSRSNVRSTRCRSRSIEDRYQWTRRSTSRDKSKPVARSRSSARLETSRHRNEHTTEMDKRSRYRSKSINEVEEIRNTCRSPEEIISQTRTAVRCRSVTPMPSRDFVEVDFHDDWKERDIENADTRYPWKAMNPEERAGLKSSNDDKGCNPVRKVIGYQQYTDRVLDQKKTFHREDMDFRSRSSAKFKTQDGVLNYDTTKKVPQFKTSRDERVPSNQDITDERRKCTEQKIISELKEQWLPKETKHSAIDPNIPTNSVVADPPDHKRQENSKQVKANSTDEQYQEPSEEKAGTLVSEVQNYKPAMIWKLEKIEAFEKFNLACQKQNKQQLHVTSDMHENKLNIENHGQSSTTERGQSSGTNLTVDDYHSAGKQNDSIKYSKPMDVSENGEATRHSNDIAKDEQKEIPVLQEQKQRTISCVQQRDLVEKNIISDKSCRPKREPKTVVGEKKRRKSIIVATDDTSKSLSEDNSLPTQTSKTDQQIKKSGADTYEIPSSEDSNRLIDSSISGSHSGVYNNSKELDVKSTDKSLPFLTSRSSPNMPKNLDKKKVENGTDTAAGEEERRKSDKPTTNTCGIITSNRLDGVDEKEISGCNSGKNSNFKKQKMKSEDKSLPLLTEELKCKPSPIMSKTFETTKVKKRADTAVGEEEISKSTTNTSKTISEYLDRVVGEKLDPGSNTEAQIVFNNSKELDEKSRTEEPKSRSCLTIAKILDNNEEKNDTGKIAKEDNKKKLKKSTENSLTEESTIHVEKLNICSESSETKIENDVFDLKSRREKSSTHSAKNSVESGTIPKRKKKGTDTIVGEERKRKLERVIDSISKRKSSEHLNNTVDEKLIIKSESDARIECNDSKKSNAESQEVLTLPSPVASLSNNITVQEKEKKSESSMSHENVLSTEKEVNKKIYTGSDVPSLRNLSEESFSRPIKIQSTPQKHREPKRKRITPIPVKDPVCSFENILEKNRSPFSRDLSTQASPLTLTHEGEIPVLHLEDNHFCDLKGENQRAVDSNIMSLLDQMNISNMDCDITKFGSSNEKTEAAKPATSVSFENAINKTEEQEASDVDPKETVKEAVNCMAQDKTDIEDTPSSGQNTSLIRRRRRCRLVVLD